MKSICLSLWLLVPWGLYADETKPLFDAVNGNEPSVESRDYVLVGDEVILTAG